MVFLYRPSEETPKSTGSLKQFTNIVNCAVSLRPESPRVDSAKADVTAKPREVLVARLGSDATPSRCAENDKHDILFFYLLACTIRWFSYGVSLLRSINTSYRYVNFFLNLINVP